MRSLLIRSGILGRRSVVVAVLVAAIGTSSYGLASGWPPIAREDSLSVVRGGEVTVLDGGASSVLDNDVDFERDELTAVLTRDPKEGELTLEASGRFVYRHNGGNKQDDEFKYRAFDGTGFSRETRVRIRIEQPKNNPPFVIDVPPNQEAAAGVYFELALAGYFGDPDPGDTLTYSASGLPGSRSLTINPTTGVLSGTPARTDARDRHYDVRVTAQDPYGARADLDFDLIIYPGNRADLSVTALFNGHPVTLGQTARWDINIENLGPADLEEGDLQAQWLTSGSSLSLTAPQGCSISGNNTRTPSISCTLDGLAATQVSAISVEGTQAGDGDNSLIAVAISDDPVSGNNAYLAGGSVVDQFSQGPTQIVSVGASGLAGADLNGDGHYDVVATTGNATTVYFNSGNRSLSTPGTSLGSGSGGNVVAVLDWNGDGAVDIAVAGVAGRIFLNDGNGGVAESFSLNVGNIGTVHAIGSADFDLDGDDDLVLAGAGDAVVIRSDGGKRFSSQSLPGAGGLDVAVADLNNDTYTDIVLVNPGDRSLRLLRNSGNGRDFSSQSLQRGSVAGVSAADVNGDGDVDLLLAVDGADLELPESLVLIQRSDGSFPAGNKIGASPLSKLLAGDIDGDLRTDLIAINDAGVHQVYLGRASGGFDLNAEQIVSDGMQRGLVVDFNGDSSLDLILAGKPAGVFELHANNGIGSLGPGDRNAPVIVLNGPVSMTLASGEGYIEEGAVATDDIDGDVTTGIVITNNVNPAVLGTYTVSYSVTDRAGNPATAIRTVQVGVNQGTGGSGGGFLSPLFLLLQLLLVVTIWHRARRP